MKIILNCCPRWVCILIELFRRQNWDYLTQTAEPNNKQVSPKRHLKKSILPLSWTFIDVSERREKRQRRKGRADLCCREWQAAGGVAALPPVKEGPIRTRTGRQSGLWEEERSATPDKLVGKAKGWGGGGAGGAGRSRRRHVSRQRTWHHKQLVHSSPPLMQFLTQHINGPIEHAQ